jgi:hypothetical protein
MPSHICLSNIHIRVKVKQVKYLSVVKWFESTHSALSIGRQNGVHKSPEQPAGNVPVIIEMVYQSECENIPFRVNTVFVLQ